MWYDMTGSSLDVILRVLPKRVLKVPFHLGIAAHLITHHVSWTGQQEKFRVLHFTFSEKEKPMTCMPGIFLFTIYQYAPVRRWTTSTNIPLHTLGHTPSPASWLTAPP